MHFNDIKILLKQTIHDDFYFLCSLIAKGFEIAIPFYLKLLTELFSTLIIA